MPIKIMLVDDHKIVRQGILELLRKCDKYDVISEAENGRVAISQLNQLNPDVIIMDIEMPELNGIDALSIIKKRFENIHIIIMSMFDKSNYICEALRKGASGYLLKDINADELFSAIDSVYEGNIYLCERINQQVIHGYVDLAQEKEYSSPINTLSPREREVFQLVAEGSSGKEIADKLNISYKTVEHHKYKIMSKLGCLNTTQLVRLAIKEGIISS